METGSQNARKEKGGKLDLRRFYVIDLGRVLSNVASTHLIMWCSALELVEQADV